MDTPNLGNESLNQHLLSRLALPPAQKRVGLEGLEVAVPPAPLMKIRDRVMVAESTLHKRAEMMPDVDREVVRELVRNGETGLHKLANEGMTARLTSTEVLGVEAIVETDGSRPVLMVQDGTINLADPDLNNELGRYWQDAARDRLRGIERIAASVGVIQLPDFDNARVGTGFVIAPGLILTNRHVLEAIARLHDGVWSWRFRAQIDFCGEFERQKTSIFDLESVVLSGPDPIDNRINFSNLDVAVIRLRVGTSEFPPALDLGNRIDAMRVKPGSTPSVYVMGFPAKPVIIAGGNVGTSPPAVGTEYGDVLTRLFKDVFSVKRWAPGFVEAGAGQLFDDHRKWVMSYDSSTLAGNSGSCVVDLSGNNALVVGLHFGGRSRAENWGHVLAAIKERFEGMDLQWKSAY